MLTSDRATFHKLTMHLRNSPAGDLNLKVTRQTQSSPQNKPQRIVSYSYLLYEGYNSH